MDGSVVSRLPWSRERSQRAAGGNGQRPGTGHSQLAGQVWASPLQVECSTVKKGIFTRVIVIASAWLVLASIWPLYQRLQWSRTYSRLTNTIVRSAELWRNMSANSLAWVRRPAFRSLPSIWSKASHSFIQCVCVNMDSMCVLIWWVCACVNSFTNQHWKNKVGTQTHPPKNNKQTNTQNNYLSWWMQWE